ncbi:recombinase family protein [Acrocarpospora catenulata]|uniref:recombinase family protein n=1 Tax=Acrocarpospora catenulata TaxID=2836182 RepID=UPI001BD99224|nr:recombinase family protein [Acrocarpospora catenulata]
MTVATAPGQPVSPALIPVFSYARASSDKRKKDQHSVKEQHRINRRTAKRHGWVVVAELTDNDKSAADPNVYRDDFEEMLILLKAGRLRVGSPVRGVVVVHSDRLVRRPGDYERFVEAFTYNDEFVFADEKITHNLYSEDVESMGLLGAVVAKIEVRKMQRRMRNTHRRLAENGEPALGRRAFGWKADKVNLEPVEADLLRDAVRDVLAGRSINSVATEWNAKGILTANGKTFRPTTVRAMLLAPRLCGWSTLKKEIVLGADGNPVVGRWVPIIKPEQHLALTELLSQNKRSGFDYSQVKPFRLPGDKREVKYLLVGFLRCGRLKEDGTMCNARLITTPGRKRHNYMCPRPNMGGCAGISRNGPALDEHISELVLAALEDATIGAAITPVTDTSGLENALREAQEAYDEHFRQYRAKKINKTSFYRLLPDLEEDLNQARAAVNRHEAASAVRDARARTDVADIRRRWYTPEQDGGLPLSMKRTYIREALHTVVVLPVPINRRGRFPFNPDLVEPVWRED